MGDADDMAAFPGPAGHVILIRNHELDPTAKAASAFGDNNEWLHMIPISDVCYWGHGNTPGLGGTSTPVYNRQRGLVEMEIAPHLTMLHSSPIIPDQIPAQQEQPCRAHIKTSSFLSPTIGLG